MNKLLVKVAMLVVSFGLTAYANALVVTDNIVLKDYAGGYVGLSAGESFSVTHSLTRFGVPDPMQVDSAKLTLSFADDQVGPFQAPIDFTWESDLWGGTEHALVDGAGISGQYEIGGHIFDYFIKKITIGDAGIDALNTSGLIDVTVTALSGDFYWKESKLKAVISEIPVTEVSEPGTLAMLGLGLASLGWIRRRKLA